MQGEEKVQEKIISDDVTTEWKTFRQFMSKQPKANMKLQLKELVTNDMLTAMFPNLSTLGNICLSIPASTASVERSFSQMKLPKTRLQNRLSDSSLLHLMKIAIKSPDKLSDSDTEEIVNVWNRKSRRVLVKVMCVSVDNNVSKSLVYVTCVLNWNLPMDFVTQES